MGLCAVLGAVAIHGGITVPDDDIGVRISDTGRIVSVYGVDLERN
jgi:hypothetical protein